MATWSEVQQYIRSNYTVQNETRGDSGREAMSLVFALGAGRTQILSVEGPMNPPSNFYRILLDSSAR